MAKIKLEGHHPVIAVAIMSAAAAAIVAVAAAAGTVAGKLFYGNK